MNQQVIPSQIFIFRSLLDFAQFVNRNLELHKMELARYEEELGLMLRQAEDNPNEELAKEIKSKLTEDKKTTEDKKSTEVKGKDKEKDKEKDEENKERKAKKEKHGVTKNWVRYKDLHIFTGNATKGKTDVYFGAVNELKVQIDKLKKTKETLDQLASAGISNVFYLVYAKNGIPDKLVLMPQEPQELAKFEFKADFVTENAEVPIESRSLSRKCLSY